MGTNRGRASPKYTLFEYAHKGWDVGIAKANFGGPGRWQRWKLSLRSWFQGHIEQWVQMQTAYIASLAYLNEDETWIELQDGSNGKAIDKLAGKSSVRLCKAPLNVNYSGIEMGKITVTTSSGDAEQIEVVERSKNDSLFVGLIKLKAGGMKKNDGFVSLNGESNSLWPWNL